MATLRRVIVVEKDAAGREIRRWFDYRPFVSNDYAEAPVHDQVEEAEVAGAGSHQSDFRWEFPNGSGMAPAVVSRELLVELGKLE